MSDKDHSVRQIAEEIVAREGGYVNDPDDPGGATNHGVTIGTMRSLGIDLTGDGKVNTADVKALTRARAVDIYLEHYFKRPGIAALPEVLQASVFDMQVNAGSNAVKILQRMLSGFGFPCSVDGKIGPQTIKAAQLAYEAAPDKLADAYGIARLNYYYALADSRPASVKYVRRRDGGKGGWITRAEEFISPKYHLTAAQHSARLSGTPIPAQVTIKPGKPITPAPVKPDIGRPITRSISHSGWRGWIAAFFAWLGKR